MTKQNEQYWKNKLLAFLHDPPCKALNIREHEQIAKQFMQSAGFTQADIIGYEKSLKSELLKAGNSQAELNGFNKHPDHIASAIDRFPFPQKVCTAHFDGQEGNTFIHPFSNRQYFMFRLKRTEGKYVGVLQDAFGAIKGNWKQKFFLYWRRWLENAILHQENNSGNLAFFPADTRIPDHTIWTHMAITSALEGCRNRDGKIKPAFLIFQAGPVQDFIAAARSTRDLWSGSYMLSWLTGNAIKAITDEVGPDSVIFPALRGLGIFDAMNKDLYDEISYQGKDGKTDTLWNRLYNDGNKDQKIEQAKYLLNPAMPNRFFAIVPEDRAEELAKSAEKAFREALNDIAEYCWDEFESDAEDLGIKDNDIENWQKRWNKQIELLPQITWQVMPIEQNIDKIIERAEKLPAMQEDNSALKTIKQLIKLATETIPKEHRDSRFYTTKDKDRLKNWGITWALNYALCDYALAARRNTRDFAPFKTDQHQDGASKDVLTGKEEIIGTPEFWAELTNQESSPFKDNEGPYGAISIIKRLWCWGDNNYLFKELDINKSIFNRVVGCESVQDIAKGNIESTNPYVAVIALDGDQMGKWMSGEKAPTFLNQLAGKAPKYFRELPNNTDIENIKRPLTPSYHLQFSEALANFANHLAGRIVKDCGGQLIYAGGDDVLAMVPATKAIHCAQLLRAAFRGDCAYAEQMADYNKQTFAFTQPGFANVGDFLKVPLILPGIKADVSCGIAIAHEKYPLQRMVKEAQIAEKRAKKEYKRASVAISLLKRGGEIVHWGTKWENEALKLYDKYCEQRREENSPISARFPYALAGLLAPYELEKITNENVTKELNVKNLIKTELNHVLEQQVSKLEIRDKLRELSEQYLEKICQNTDNDNRIRYEDFAKLFLTAAFIERDRGE